MPEARALATHSATRLERRASIDLCHARRAEMRPNASSGPPQPRRETGAETNASRKAGTRGVLSDGCFNCNLTSTLASTCAEMYCHLKERAGPPQTHIDEALKSLAGANFYAVCHRSGEGSHWAVGGGREDGELHNVVPHDEVVDGAQFCLLENELPHGCASSLRTWGVRPLVGAIGASECAGAEDRAGNEGNVGGYRERHVEGVRGDCARWGRRRHTGNGAEPSDLRGRPELVGVWIGRTTCACGSAPVESSAGIGFAARAGKQLEYSAFKLSSAPMQPFVAYASVPSGLPPALNLPLN